MAAEGTAAPTATATPAPPAAPVADAPSPAQPVQPQPAIQTSPGLLGSISISNIKTALAEAPKLQAEVRPLTAEDLERYWKETGEELELVDLMAGGRPQLGDHSGRIDIVAENTWFADEFKPHRIAVMEALRAKSGMPMLDCKVIPLYLDKDEVVYSPNDKYNAMLQQNPHLLALRKLFPQIDY